MTQFLSVKDVADRLKMSVHFVYGEVKSGAMEHYALGGAGRKSIRISEEQLQSYLDKQTADTNQHFYFPAGRDIASSTATTHTVSYALNKLLDKKRKTV